MTSLNVVLITLGDPERVTGGYLYNRRIAERAVSNAAHMPMISIPAHPRPLVILRARRVLKAAVTLAPDALAIDSICAGAVAPWTRIVGYIPAFGLVHQKPGGVDAGPLASRLGAWLDVKMYQQAAGVIVVGESLRNHLVARGVDVSNIYLVPPGRDPPGVGEAMSRIDLRRGRKVAFLCVANWLPQKGIVDVVEAFASLPEGTASLTLVGDTDQNSRYTGHVRRAIGRLGLEGSVLVIGRVPPSEVWSYYRAADAFVLASTAEAYGTVYSEAMFAGLPLVGWDTGNLPYLVRNGIEGLTVPFGDKEALGEALRRLASDSELRTAIGANARARAETFPTWDESARLFFQVIRNEALSSPSA